VGHAKNKEFVCIKGVCQTLRVVNLGSLASDLIVRQRLEETYTV
jgi:hypothetical protein